MDVVCLKLSHPRVRPSNRHHPTVDLAAVRASGVIECVWLLAVDLLCLKSVLVHACLSFLGYLFIVCKSCAFTGGSFKPACRSCFPLPRETDPDPLDALPTIFMEHPARAEPSKFRACCHFFCRCATFPAAVDQTIDMFNSPHDQNFQSSVSVYFPLAEKLAIVSASATATSLPCPVLLYVALSLCQETEEGRIG